MPIFISINEVMLTYMVHDRNTFNVITNLDQLIYPGGYNGLQSDKGNLTKCNFGFVLTTNRLLIDAYKAMSKTPEGLKTTFDCTFSLCMINWVFRKNLLQYRTSDREYRQTYNFTFVCLIRNK